MHTFILLYGVLFIFLFTSLRNICEEIYSNISLKKDKQNL